jgi:hypothetical protein
MDFVQDLDIGATKVSLYVGKRSIWEEYQDVEDKFNELLVKVRQNILILNSRIVQIQLKAFFKVK